MAAVPATVTGLYPTSGRRSNWAGLRFLVIILDCPDWVGYSHGMATLIPTRDTPRTYVTVGTPDRSKSTRSFTVYDVEPEELEKLIKDAVVASNSKEA